jgi:transposase
MPTDRVPRHSLSDEQWGLIEDLFPTNNFKTGRRPRGRRVLLNAMFWILRTGAAWRDVPAEFGPWKTVWNFFDKWSSDGTFDKMLRRLREHVVPDDGEADELWCIDGTSIRAARCSGGGGKRTTPVRTRRSRFGALQRWIRLEDPHPM